MRDIQDRLLVLPQIPSAQAVRNPITQEIVINKGVQLVPSQSEDKILALMQEGGARTQSSPTGNGSGELRSKMAHIAKLLSGDGDGEGEGGRDFDSTQSWSPARSQSLKRVPMRKKVIYINA